MKTFLSLILLVFLLTGCSQTSNISNDSSSTTDKQTSENGTLNSIPDNLIACDPSYFKRGPDGVVLDCDSFDGDKVCSYQTKEQKGKIKNETIQFNNPCSACRFYGEKGVRKIGSATFTHHGYIEGGCEGIIWK